MILVETRERKYTRVLKDRSLMMKQDNVGDGGKVNEKLYFLFFKEGKREEMKHKEKQDLCRIYGP